MAQAVVNMPSAETAAPTRAGRAWLFGPWIDLLFVANLAWPLVFFAMFWGGLEIQGRVAFWQVYFVTTPHRWITLPLVFCDRERFRERPQALLWVAGIVTVLCLGVRISTGTLTCLLAIDYAWNAWHFAAQHHGIFRIYGRMSQPERTTALTAEKVLMRLFVMYIAFRTVTWAWMPSRFPELRFLDFAALAIPVWLLGREFAAFDRRATGRVAYLLSFSFLYSGLLICLHTDQPALVLMFTTASAIFHAVEYLAVVSWSVDSRHGKRENRETLFSRLLPQWALVMLTFVGILGIGGWMVSHRFVQTWLLLNIIIAFLHYAYDGLIWKSKRRPQTSP